MKNSNWCKIGQLTVINEIIRNKRKYFVCKCDCGNEKVIRKDSVVSGSTLSCGCLNKKKVSEKNTIDLTGKRFGRLTILRKSEDSRKSSIYWKCKCDCGAIKDIDGSHLRRGYTNSCGCIRKEGNHNYEKHKRLYGIWSHIKTRCTNKKYDKYKYYGGKGVSVCSEWDNFDNFKNWALDNGYSEELTIDRINVNGNYEPSNCRWVDIKTQCRNRTSNLLVEYKGKEITLVELSEITGLSYRLLWDRYKVGDRGDRLKRALR